MFCSKCGNALPSGSLSCRRCRTPVAQNAALGVPSGQVSLERPGLITLLAVLHFVAAAAMLLFMVVTFASFHDKDPIPFPFALLFLVWFALSLFAGIGLWKLEEYGRNLQIVFSCLGLLAFPMGTLISVLVLVYLNKPGVKVLFSGKTQRELTADDIVALQGMGTGGSTLAVVALVLVVGIGMMGILAAIAIPNLLTAMQRAKQKRTMADMRQIAAQIEKYREANRKLPEGSTSAELPSAIHSNILVDGWGHNLRYATDGRNYWLVSAGKDGVFETEKPEEYAQSTTTTFNSDIVIENSEWLRVPEGAQH